MCFSSSGTLTFLFCDTHDNDQLSHDALCNITLWLSQVSLKKLKETEAF